MAENKYICQSCFHKGMCLEYDDECYGCPHYVNTADVAPRCEVEALEKEIDRLKKILDYYALQYGTVKSQQQVIDRAKSEVAREIFEEIEAEIVAALESNYSVRSERMKRPRLEMADEFISCIEGKINALRGMEWFIAELKQKYTEEQK